jgi:Sulfotransferase family
MEMEPLSCTFLIGAGRSGSTAFHELLVGHPHAAWLSRSSRRFPGHPGRNHLAMRSVGLPVLGPVAARWLEPGEHYEFWDHYYPGFSVPFRDLVADDVLESTRRQLRSALARMRTPKRSHLVIKITGWPRVGFLRAIFPEGRFVHVVRDGRAVASSLLKVPWWWGWRGPANWRWGPLTPELDALWAESGRSFVALAAIQWRILMEATMRSCADLGPDRFLQLRYEDLCEDPGQWCRRVTDFAGLAWTGSFDQRVRRSRFRSENEKWRRDFTPRQQEILESLISEQLAQFGYLK